MSNVISDSSFLAKRTIWQVLLCVLIPLSGFAVTDWKQEYRLERKSLTQEQIVEILDRGNELLSRTDLVNSLIEGGSAFFPHTYLQKCGDQIAAVALASLDAAEKSGKKQILVLGVLHPLTPVLKAARRKERLGMDVSSEPLRGIFGPDLSNNTFLESEYSVESFLFLLEKIAEIKGSILPRVIVRYPFLVQGVADTLPGMEELKKLAADSIVVATGDLCHHGTPYGTSIEEALPIGETAYAFAHRSIQKTLDFLNTVNLLAYRACAQEANNDAMHAGQAMSALLGPLEGKIIDLRLIDFAYMFTDYQGPIWIAATLVELKPLKK